MEILPLCALVATIITLIVPILCCTDDPRVLSRIPRNIVTPTDRVGGYGRAIGRIPFHALTFCRTHTRCPTALAVMTTIVSSFRIGFDNGEFYFTAWVIALAAKIIDRS